MAGDLGEEARQQGLTEEDLLNDLEYSKKDVMGKGMATDEKTLRGMVDANILIAGSVWPRWPFKVLQHAIRGDF